MHQQFLSAQASSAELTEGSSRGGPGKRPPPPLARREGEKRIIRQR